MLTYFQNVEGRWLVHQQGHSRVIADFPHENAAKQWAALRSPEMRSKKWSSLREEAERRGLLEEFDAVLQLNAIFEEAGFCAGGSRAISQEQRWELGFESGGYSLGLQSHIALANIRHFRQTGNVRFVWRRVSSSRWGRPHIEGLNVAAIDALTLPPITQGVCNGV